MPLTVNRIAIMATATVPESLLANYLPAPLNTLGEELAQHVDQYVSQHQLGYYPALDFFRAEENAGAIADYLIPAVDEIANIAAAEAGKIIMAQLRPVFSSVKIKNMQCLAFTMPTVRPRQEQALKQLAQHYVPDTLKLEFAVSLLQKRETAEGLEKSAANMCYRWLGEVFSGFEVTHSRLLPATD